MLGAIPDNLLPDAPAAAYADRRADRNGPHRPRPAHPGDPADPPRHDRRTARGEARGDRSRRASLHRDPPGGRPPGGVRARPARRLPAATRNTAAPGELHPERSARPGHGGARRQARRRGPAGEPRRFAVVRACCAVLLACGIVLLATGGQPVLGSVPVVVAPLLAFWQSYATRLRVARHRAENPGPLTIALADSGCAFTTGGFRQAFSWSRFTRIADDRGHLFLYARRERPGRQPADAGTRRRRPVRRGHPLRLPTSAFPRPPSDRPQRGHPVRWHVRGRKIAGQGSVHGPRAGLAFRITAAPPPPCGAAGQTGHAPTSAGASHGRDRRPPPSPRSRPADRPPAPRRRRPAVSDGRYGRPPMNRRVSAGRGR